MTINAKRKNVNHRNGVIKPKFFLEQYAVIFQKYRKQISLKFHLHEHQQQQLTSICILLSVICHMNTIQHVCALTRLIYETHFHPKWGVEFGVKFDISLLIDIPMPFPIYSKSGDPRAAMPVKTDNLNRQQKEKCICDTPLRLQFETNIHF